MQKKGYLPTNYGEHSIQFYIENVLTLSRFYAQNAYNVKLY